MPRGSRFVTRVLASLLLASAGCSVAPTYHKERLVESLTELLARDHLSATVRLIDRTLAIQCEYPHALAKAADGAQLGLGPGFEEGARIVLTAVHRVVLSSDADVQFYLLLISDPELPGAYLTMVRYLEDIRKANVSIIGVSEMMARTVFELNLVESPPITLGQYLPREIHLSDFLTWQLTRRIRQELTDALQSDRAVTVDRCQGQFLDGEFVFVLNAVPTGEAPLDEKTLHVVFDTTAKLIATVLSGYDFESFNAVRLINPATGRNIVLPRANLAGIR